MTTKYDKDDLRTKSIYLTHKGRKLLEQMKAAATRQGGLVA